MHAVLDVGRTEGYTSLTMPPQNTPPASPTPPDDLETQGLQHLKNIEEELEAIRDRTTNPRRTFVMGILQGAGAIFGGLLALGGLGWILSILGVIPGLGDSVEYVRSLLDTLPTRRF